MKNNRHHGFTLIEVLIALVILSIALTAIIKASSQNIKDTIYTQQKTIALWVGTDVMNEIRAGLIKPPEAPDKITDKKDSLGQEWSYTANLQATPNPKIKSIAVSVFAPHSDSPLIHLESYLYAQ